MQALKLAVKYGLLMVIGIAWIVIVAYVPFTVGHLNKGYGVYRLNTPSEFYIHSTNRHLSSLTGVATLNSSSDLSKYFMLDYDEITFYSKNSNVELSGWWVQKNSESPTIILVHGLSDSKAFPRILISAGMLYKHGYNVFLIDLRNHGKSHDIGFHTVGINESYDVLAAVDWLVDEKGIPVNRIGLVGQSFGAITAAISFVRNPEIPALFLDSSSSSFKQLVLDEIDIQGWPKFISRLTVFSFIYGFSTNEIEPLDAIRYANGRDIFITHAVDDDRVRYHHALALVDEAKKVGASVEFWPVDNVGHCNQLYAFPYLYEQRMIGFFNRVFGYSLLTD